MTPCINFSKYGASCVPRALLLAPLCSLICHCVHLRSLTCISSGASLLCGCFRFRIRLHHRRRVSRLEPSRPSGVAVLSVRAPASTRLVCVALSYAPGSNLLVHPCLYAVYPAALAAGASPTPDLLEPALLVHVLAGPGRVPSQGPQTRGTGEPRRPGEWAAVFGRMRAAHSIFIIHYSILKLQAMARRQETVYVGGNPVDVNHLTGDSRETVPLVVAMLKGVLPGRAEGSAAPTTGTSMLTRQIS
jgi:hypothetical protein